MSVPQGFLEIIYLIREFLHKAAHKIFMRLDVLSNVEVYMSSVLGLSQSEIWCPVYKIDVLNVLFTSKRF